MRIKRDVLDSTFKNLLLVDKGAELVVAPVSVAAAPSVVDPSEAVASPEDPESSDEAESV